MTPTTTSERPQTRVRQPNAVVLSYSELLKSVKTAGLLERRVGFYITRVFQPGAADGRHVVRLRADR